MFLVGFSAPVSRMPCTVRSAVRSAGAVAAFRVCRKYFKSIYLCVFVDVCVVYWLALGHYSIGSLVDLETEHGAIQIRSAG